MVLVSTLSLQNRAVFETSSIYFTGLSVSATQQVVDRLNHRRSSKKWVVEEHIDIETVAEVHFLCKVYPFEVYKADLYTLVICSQSSFVHNPQQKTSHTRFSQR